MTSPSAAHEAATGSPALVTIDGAFVAADAAKVSVFDRGFVYGDGIFETLRTYGRVLRRLDDHLHRLERSAAILRIELPVDRASLARELVRSTEIAFATLAARGSPAELELVVRVQVTRGPGALGLLPRGPIRPTRVAWLMPYVDPESRLYEEGAAVVFAPTYRPSDAARGAKIANYAESIIALAAARDVGADEALIVNAGGFVVEGTTSNVFVVRDGALFTPPASSGALEGITRKIVIEVAREIGLDPIERDLPPDDVRSADEIFITSTLRGIMPVGRVEGRDLPADRPITARLREAFEAHVGENRASTNLAR